MSTRQGTPETNEGTAKEKIRTPLVLKWVWGALISIATVVLAVGEYRISSVALRPYLSFKPINATDEMRQLEGKLTHAVIVQNTGGISAQNVTFSVVTRSSGETLHEDRAHDIGLVVKGESTTYYIHVHDPNGKEAIERGRPIIEEFSVSYKGRNTLQFWCDPIYTYSAKFLYDAKADRWKQHPESRSVEIETCE